jgi:small basic protein
MDVAVAQKLGVALAIGFVIGAERGWETREAAEGGRTAGLRTFALTGLFGGLAALLAERFGASLLAVGFLGVAALAVASYFALVRVHGDLGFTTELALVLTYGLGALAGSGIQLEAVAAAVVVAAILGFKRELHRGLAWLERREVTATLQLLLIAAVALPLLPDRAMGPFEALNPRRIGLLVLLLAAISYGGWFAVRIAGERAGLLLTAAFGGLASSTAVTLTYARLARAHRAPAAILGAGIAVACGCMALRLAVAGPSSRCSAPRALLAPSPCCRRPPPADGSPLQSAGTRSRAPPATLEPRAPRRWQRPHGPHAARAPPSTGSVAAVHAAALSGSPTSTRSVSRCPGRPGPHDLDVATTDRIAAAEDQAGIGGAALACLRAALSRLRSCPCASSSALV